MTIFSVNPYDRRMERLMMTVPNMSTVHCKFDNGRQLGIIPGEDSFRKLTDEQSAVPAQKGIKKTACRRSAFNHGCDDSFKAVLFYIPKHIE